MSDVTIGTTEAVSIRAIAEDGEGMSSPVSLRNLANERGIDRTFALRELITSQAWENDHLKELLTENYLWENWLSDHKEITNRFRPQNADDVRELLAGAASSDRTIRAVGAGHSHSQVARPDDFFIELSWYDSEGTNGLVGALDQRPRRSDLTEASNYGPGNDPATDEEELEAIRVAAGETLKSLNRRILYGKELGLLNMGSFDGQTVAGAVNTSTHGTGIGLGTFADVVLSVEMGVVMESPVDDEEAIVRMFRIEPKEGITDSEAFMENVGEHGMALIQDDDIFHASVVGYGAMGVATSYTLLVRDRYFLEEHSNRKPNNRIGSAEGGWKKMKTEETVKKRLNDDGIRHFNFLLNIPGTFGSPSTDGPSCLLRKRWKRPWNSSLVREADGYGPDGGKKELGIPQRRGFNDFARNFRRWTSGSGVDPKTNNPGLASSIRNNYFKKLQNKHPFKRHGGDNAGKYNETASYEALRRIPDRNHIDKEGPPEGPQDPAMTTEVAVPVEHVEDAVDAVIDEVQNVHDSDDFHYMAPLGVRFTAPSEHMLAPEFQSTENTDGDESTDSEWPAGFAMLELPFTVGRVDASRADWTTFIPGVGVLTGLARLTNALPSRDISQSEMVDMSKDALEPIEQRLRKDFDGRPHMGKHHSLERSDLEDLYDRFDTWYDVYTQFNAFGTFNNGFTDDLGISVNR